MRATKRYEMEVRKGPQAGLVFEIRDTIQDEAIVPQFCCKTVEGAKRNFAMFLSQNKLKKSDFTLNLIGNYNADLPERICYGSQVLVEDYLDKPVEEPGKEE